jgi:predicted regulator of amino acid metabolism with ACT domain
MNDIEIVKDLIIKETGIDVAKRTRQREVIELRSLFYKVAKELKPNSSYSAIGRCVGYNHATVLHSLGMFEVYSKYNKSLNKIKGIVTKRFKLESGIYGIKAINKEIEDLELRIIELKELKEFLENDKKVLVD